MGAKDPRLDHFGKVDFRLNRMLSAWKKADPPPHRVKPIPIKVIRAIAFVAQHSTCPIVVATADMIILAFFFLLRPGEYTGTTSETQPFQFNSVQLFMGGARLDLNTATDDQLHAATVCSLTFDRQKNGVRGEVIGHYKSHDPYVCPVLALVRRVLHLRSNTAAQDTPLAVVYRPGSRTPVTPAMITQTLRHHVSIIGPSLGFLPPEVSVRSLRAAGANALLTAKIDTNVIQLIGRWRSDEMLRYLHVQNQELMRSYAGDMLHSGDYNLIPNQFVPMH